MRGLLIFILGAMFGAAPAPEVTKVCPEDAVILGVGEYTGGEGWERYICLAADDVGFLQGR